MNVLFLTVKKYNIFQTEFQFVHFLELYNIQK